MNLAKIPPSEELSGYGDIDVPFPARRPDDSLDNIDLKPLSPTHGRDGGDGEDGDERDGDDDDSKDGDRRDGAGGDRKDKKTYSFVSLPGNAVKKRPRRRYDEIERLYQCK